VTEATGIDADTETEADAKTNVGLITTVNTDTNTRMETISTHDRGVNNTLPDTDTDAGTCLQ